MNEMAHKVRGGEAGFTLVEVLVAAALFVGVFVTLATLFAQATTGLSGTRLLSATSLAQTAMEAAIQMDSPASGGWTVRANRILWEVEQTVEQTKSDILRVSIVVRRVSDGKVHASASTELYRPTEER